MRIEFRNGEKFLLFEDKDKELKENFLAGLKKAEELTKEVRDAYKEVEAAQRRLTIAVKKMDLSIIESREAFWKPVEDAAEEQLGLVDLALLFNQKTEEFAVTDKNVEMIADELKRAMEILGSVKKEQQQQADDDETIH